MDPNIITKPAFKAVGMNYQGKGNGEEIPQLWADFMNRWEEINYRLDNKTSYGVTTYFDMETLAFEYMACLPVQKIDDIPEGMVSVEVPEGTYAEFTTSLSTMKEDFDYAYRTWLPQSGYIRPNTPDYEEYDSSFNGEDPNSKFKFYVPLEKA